MSVFERNYKRSLDLQSGDARRSFAYMWRLIDQYGEATTAFSTELLLGLFWEETTFRNMKQFGGGPGRGFGQVELNTIQTVSKSRKSGVGEAIILMYDPASVQIAQHTLEFWHKALGSTDAALNAYAGVTARPQNASAVRQWKACEQILKVPVLTAETIKQALKAAAPNNGALINDQFVLSDTDLWNS